MTRICFIDTETTSLRHDRRAWEIGIIVREPGHEDAEHHWFIDVRDLDLGNADAASLKIGRFYDRHPQVAALHMSDPAVRREDDAMRRIETLIRGAHIVGAVPNFDTEVLGTRMRVNGICPSWHYHLTCVEALAAGWLNRHAAVLENREATMEEASWTRHLARPPWKSDDLSAALGIKVSDEDRHTALGDAKWARALFDAVTGGGNETR